MVTVCHMLVLKPVTRAHATHTISMMIGTVLDMYFLIPMKDSVEYCKALNV